MKEVVNIHKIFSVSPVFGVDFSLESEAPSIQQLLQPRIEEDTEIIEDREDSTYYDSLVFNYDRSREFLIIDILVFFQW